MSLSNIRLLLHLRANVKDIRDVSLPTKVAGNFNSWIKRAPFPIHFIHSSYLFYPSTLFILVIYPICLFSPSFFLKIGSALIAEAKLYYFIFLLRCIVFFPKVKLTSVRLFTKPRNNLSK